jgi:hypothetical protein
MAIAHERSETKSKRGTRPAVLAIALALIPAIATYAASSVDKVRAAKA